MIWHCSGRSEASAGVAGTSTYSFKTLTQSSEYCMSLMLQASMLGPFVWFLSVLRFIFLRRLDLMRTMFSRTLSTFARVGSIDRDLQ